ncbi:MAG: DUF2336 domain-containing protein [Proteobacteria bacterium]|nr:DUF2336 domain-containing protein [Pseudomonadota bacterium]
MPAKAVAEKPLSTLAEDLATLANERSPDKRLELLRGVASAYATHAEPGMAAELYLFNEIVSKLVNKIAGAHRATAARALATMKSLPDGILRQLATDPDIAVARPMIRDYEAMPEAILVEVARTGSQDHLQVIAARDQVTPPVSDVVAERGDARVVRILAGNRGARFSDAGMGRMIDRAAADTDLQALLVERKDLSLAAIGRLLPIINEELAGRLQGGAAAVREADVVQHLADWISERKKNVERTAGYITGIRNGDLNINDILSELLSQQRLYDAADVLGAAVGLDGEYVFGVLSGGSTQSALLLMRAADLSWPVVHAFFDVRAAKVGPYVCQTPPARADYLSLDAGAARRVLRFIKARHVACGIA